MYVLTFFLKLSVKDKCLYTSCVLFLEEFSVLLEQIMAESTVHLLISGDFNVASMQTALMKFLNLAT